MTIRCFLLEPTGRAVRKLRRFRWSSDGPCVGRDARPGAYSYCDAFEPLDVVDGTEHVNGDSWPHDDPRWPTKCRSCGRQFTAADEWQLWTEREMRRSDTGALTTIRDADPGAMWFADWLAEAGAGADHTARRAGQAHLIVKTPAGDWDIDGPSSNGNGWTREGTAPAITARPSIGIGTPFRYHAWLTAGELVDC